MNIHKYEAFLKIVELGNITKASVVLGYSQSAMSTVVSNLESEWNVKLLNRDKQGITLTSEGAFLLPAIKSVVQENNLLKHRVSELQMLDRGTINVGAFLSATLNLLPKMIQSFSALYPQILFHLKGGGYQDVAELIFNGQLDCGLVKIPTQVDIDVIPLFQDKIFAIFPDGTRPEQRFFPIKDIEKENFIMLKEVEAEVMQYLKEHNIPIKNQYFSDFDYAVFPMVESGLGMCVVSELMLKGSSYRLEVKELDPPIFRTVGIGYRKSSASAATRKFIEHVQTSFSSL